jgi:simple sugar transport system permease protein
LVSLVAPTLLVVVPAALAAGFLMGLLPGLLKVHLHANEILTTLMLNAIVPLLIDWLLSHLRLFFDLAPLLPRFSELTAFTPLSLGSLHVGAGFAIIAVIFAWLVLARTPLGYEIRTTGANEKFARYGGINTQRSIALAFAIGGALAALVGVNLAFGGTRDMFVSVTGFTFNGIVVALLARNNPLMVPLAALFYGYLLVGADAMEQRVAIGQEVLQVIQAVLVLLLAVRAWRTASHEQYNSA